MTRLIQVFRRGTHTDSNGIERTFTDSDVRTIADKFDPEIGAVPIVKGHPAHDDPAFGSVSHFMYEATSGILYAALQDVDPGFQAEVRSKRYSRVSIALHLPNSPHNPIPGMYYPRHLGFLGAAAPAVKGLKAVNFNDNGEGFLMFDVNDDDKSVNKFSEAIATAFTTALVKIGFKPEGDPHPSKKVEDSAEFKASEQGRIQAESDLKIANKEKAALENKQRRAGCASFTDELVTGGKVSPVEAERLTEILFGLDNQTEITFSEGKDDEAKLTPRKALSEFLKALPKRIEFAELSAEGDEGDLEHIGFIAPREAKVSATGMAKHRRIAAYAVKHDIEYIDAISIIERGA